MSTSPLEQGSQPPPDAPKIPTTQRLVSEASMLHSTLTRDWASCGLVGQATTVYESNLAGQVVKLSWPEPEILKELGEISDQEVKGHIPELLASQMPTTMETRLICKQLPRAHFPEPQVSRPLVINVSRKPLPVWDLTPNRFYNVWMQTLICKLDSSMPGVHD
jgi:hypothetical protein